MSISSKIKTSSASTQNPLLQLRYFIKGCTFEGKAGSRDLVKSAVQLLKTLPSTRFAVLEYFSSVYDDTIYNLLSTNEDSLDSSQYGVIDDIQESLMEFIQINPNAWTPIISAWAIELLGEISSKYTNKYAKRKNICQSASLNEILQMWMGCRATKSLIEIASQCIATMVGDTPDSCVDALLETSVKHSPHFDWVVAHIGSCFPSTIINRVLMCGLKDFCIHGGSQAEIGMVTDQDNMPKFASVVGILGHLAGQHGRDIKVALMTLFQTSLDDSGSEMYHQGVPFILRLASLSPMLLKVITTDFIQILSVWVLNRVAELSVHWYEKGEEDNDALLHLLVHLITSSDSGTYKVLLLLIDTAFPPQRHKDSMETDEPVLKPVVQKTAKQVLDLVIKDLVRAAHSQGGSNSVDVPLLRGLQGHLSPLGRMLSNSSGERYTCLCKVVTCVAIISGEGQAAKILCDILVYSKDNQHLPFFITLQEELQIKLPSILQQTLQDLLQSVQSTSKDDRRVQGLKNLLTVVKWEMKSRDNTKFTRCTFTSALESHLETLTNLIDNPNYEVASTSLWILNHTRLRKTLPIFSIVTLCHAVVSYFFRLLKSTEADKVEMCTACRMCVLRLCSYPSGQKTLLRLLVETALSKESSSCLGAKKPVNINPAVDSSVERPGVGLLASNRSLAGRTGPHMSHGGVIGQGLRRPHKSQGLSKEQLYMNKPLFLDILWSVASHGHMITAKDDDNGQSAATKEEVPLSAHIGRTIALLLIEYVTPDVMYNGIPWPDEEFMKVTIERDLLIKKQFDENPILWDVFDFLSSAGGAICYCSAIIRGVMAVLLYHWDSCRDREAANSPWHYHATCRVIMYMRKGDFLPPPLSYCGELLPFLSPYEVYLVLINIWKYMKENPPVPLEDGKNGNEVGIDSKYMEPLRPLFISKMDKLGHLYSRFFVP